MLGIIALREGMLDRAEVFSSEGLSVATPVKYVPTMAQAQHTLAAVALGRGEREAAERLARNALALYKSEQSPGRAGMLEILAEIAQAGGDSIRAARLLGSAAAIRKRERVMLAAAERAALERVIASVKATLGDSAYETEALIGSAIRCRPPNALAALGGRIEQYHPP